ncbi:MAG: hypothetical protein LBU76_08035 [Azoarcus sp.]|jgi:hypothetical protein|nr:hypothetical protein [Azoarcus sp.]
MRKYGYGKIDRLNGSLRRNGAECNIIQKIMKSGELIKASNKTKVKEDWFFNAMNTMDSLLEYDIKQKIREDCACNL